ncbi:helix-turn-helix domain-containing protein [Streptococcus gallolyticus]|uniref:helix-turn-helix domain-containing protein n=1 Tax=Streptococcus gallolyticus TaxID=315405 RepID=UPI000883EE94|nr:helix-turn-helix transcriptional regulator [Streptococcus gallolyticus]SDJ74639.1 Helix-turn-helix domain-containing protein [Streptococcus gallolyticus]SDL25056.1 Helix-turn-helix domain-containing protein [Streptococcus gallolyticus]
MRNNEEIISLIQNMIEEEHMSMSEFARRVGIAKSTMSRYFNRTREFPLNKADDFARALNISPEYLLGLEEEKTRTEIDLSNLRENVVLFDGKPLSDDDVNKIAQIIELSLGVTGRDDK